MAENTPNAQDGQSEGPNEAYKELQRKLARQQELNRKLLGESIEVEGLRLQVASVQDTVRKIAEVNYSGDDPEEVIKSAASNQESISKAINAKRAIMDNLFDTDYDWDTSEELASAREAWENGQHDRAISEVEKVVGKVNGDIGSAVQAAVHAELVRLGLRVQDGEPTGGVASEPTTVGDAARLYNEGKISSAQYAQYRSRLPF